MIYNQIFTIFSQSKIGELSKISEKLHSCYPELAEGKCTELLLMKFIKIHTAQ